MFLCGWCCVLLVGCQNEVDDAPTASLNAQTSTARLNEAAPATGTTAMLMTFSGEDWSGQDRYTIGIK
ncbi:MAG: hypothetical protein AAFX94_17965, partial [Myxococcota bacterium]